MNLEGIVISVRSRSGRSNKLLYVFILGKGKYEGIATCVYVGQYLETKKDPGLLKAAMSDKSRVWKTHSIFNKIKNGDWICHGKPPIFT